MANTVDSRVNSDIGGRANAAYAAEVGRMVRLGRAKRGMSRRQLAQESRTSERYLAQIESGAGNPSLLVMRAVADALGTRRSSNCCRSAGGSSPRTIPHRRSARRASPATGSRGCRYDRSAAPIAPPRTDRARRISLVGLRGAGKSTLGRMLAEKLGVPSSSSTAWSSSNTARACRC